MGIAKKVGSIYKIGFHNQIVEEFWNVKNLQQPALQKENYLSA